MCYVADDLLSGSADGSVYLWDKGSPRFHTFMMGTLKRGSPLLWKLNGHGGLYKRLVADFVGSESGQPLRTLLGHSNWVFCVCAVSPSMIVSGSWDNTLKVWNVDSGTELRTLQGHSNCVSCVCAVSPSTIVSGSDDKTLRTWGV